MSCRGHKQLVCCRGLLLMALCAVAVCAVAGCLMQANSEPAPRRVSPPRPVAPSSFQAPTAAKSAAYATFDQLREDLLSANPRMGELNCAFAIGVDVSQSAKDNQVLEYTTKILTDMCSFFFSPGDRIMVVPWDSEVRWDQAQSFEYSDSQEAIKNLTAAFEHLEGLVRPESRGSDLLGARRYCVEQALKMVQDSGGRLCGVVLIFTDIRVDNSEKAASAATVQSLKALRVRLAGNGNAEFKPVLYSAPENTQIWVHTLIGKAQTGKVAAVERTRAPRPAVTTTPPSPPPAPPPQEGGWKTLLIILALLALAALITLPFTWQHRITLGDTRETLRAFGGRVVIQAGRGVPSRGQVLLPVEDRDGRVLVRIEGRGPQVMAIAERGVRLNEGKAEAIIPPGKPRQLQLTIDGVPGVQVMDIQLAEFFPTNSGPIIGMIVAFVVLVASIIA